MQAKPGEWGKFWEQVSELVDAYEEAGRDGLASRLSVDLLVGMVDVAMCASYLTPAVFPVRLAIIWQAVRAQSTLAACGELWLNPGKLAGAGSGCECVASYLDLLVELVVRIAVEAPHQAVWRVWSTGL